LQGTKQTEKEEAAAKEIQKPEELPAEDSSQVPSLTGTSIYDEMFAKAECPSSAKAGKEDDIVGKWKLTLEISGIDTVD
jgi:hypothetical protein